MASSCSLLSRYTRLLLTMTAKVAYPDVCNSWIDYLIFLEYKTVCLHSIEIDLIPKWCSLLLVLTNSRFLVFWYGHLIMLSISVPVLIYCVGLCGVLRLAIFQSMWHGLCYVTVLVGLTKRFLSSSFISGYCTQVSSLLLATFTRVSFQAIKHYCCWTNPFKEV